MSIHSKQKKLALEGRSYSYKSGLLIYLSKGGIGENLNAKALDSKNQPIVCRHLAWYLASSEDGIKNYHDKLSRIESIASIPSLKNNTHDQEKVRFNSSYYHFFNLDELGVQLEGIAKTLKTNEKTSLLFNAENHLMAFDIQKKSVRDGPPVYIIKFYDPNITDKHIRIVCEDLLMLKKLSIHDLMSEAQSDAYFPKIKSAFFYSPKQCIGNEKPEIVVDEDNPPDGSLCYFLEMGLLQHHQEVIKQLIDSTTLSSKQKLNALNAKKADGMSGLCIALQNDHIDTIKCYMESILESSIKSSNKVRLLAAKNKAGYPVLYPALLYSQASTVSCYVRCITESALDGHEKVELLMAKDSDGWSGLCLALFDDQIDTAKAYLDCILVSTLDVKQKIELLTAQDRHGKSGLYAAFQHTHTDTAAIYMQCLIDTKLLTDAQKIDLFSKLVTSEQFKEILPLNTGNQYIYDALQSIELGADKKNAMKSELRSMIKESLNGAEDETKSSDVDEEPPIFQ